jgi:hypothetical protein
VSDSSLSCLGIFLTAFRNIGLRGRVQARACEGARLQLENQEIVFQSIRKIYLDRIGEFLIQNLRDLLDELKPVCTEELVLITGTGTTDNWEADAVAAVGSSISIGANADLSVFVGGSFQLDRSRGESTSPGFNTGHIHHDEEPDNNRPHDSTIDQVPTLSDMMMVDSIESANQEIEGASQQQRDSLPQSSLLDLFPRRIPFQRCCRRDAPCPERKKQYVFVKTARIRSRTFFGSALERIKVDFSDGSTVYTRWDGSLSRKPSPESSKQGSSINSPEAKEQMWEIDDQVIDSIEGSMQLGDTVDIILRSRIVIDDFQDVLYNSVADLKLKVSPAYLLSVLSLTSIDEP